MHSLSSLVIAFWREDYRETYMHVNIVREWQNLFLRTVFNTPRLLYMVCLLLIMQNLFVGLIAVSIIFQVITTILRKDGYGHCFTRFEDAT